MLTVTLLCILLGGLVFALYRHLTFWQRYGIPAYPSLYLGWASQPYFTFHEACAPLGKIFGSYKLFTKILVINDVHLVRNLSIKQLARFPIRNTFYKGTSNISKSLFFLDATEDWKRLRSIVTPAFTSGKLKSMMTPMERITGNFIEHLRPMAKSGETFDLKKYIGGLTMDIIARCAYGIELDSIAQPDHPVVVNARKILNVNASFKLLFCIFFPTAAKWLQIEAFDKAAMQYFDQLTFTIVEKRRKEEQGKRNPDFLGLLIEETQNEAPVSGENPHGKPLKGISNDELSGQGILFFVAGFDTTHATFDHALYYLAQYPEWQEKLYQELAAVRQQLNYEKYQHLPVLNAIINETLRLCPPLLEIFRESSKETELLGMTLPANTLVIIQPYMIHRDPEHFPDPLEFKPDRFLDGSGLESSNAFMSFGIGPRQCVGMRFAQNELRIGLAQFILAYRVSLAPAFKLEYFNGSVLMSPKKLLVSISER